VNREDKYYGNGELK
jgi:solute carrier family 9 (sodium/hydrogen exchanger), member 8